ncbi:MAG: Hsp20/alpha crystallin family protein [Candidatus Aureabacteria bacterium]|nr:Hsp20/alpha crystallin family protein [Candidatus Auribacterota bacterium]
MLKNILPWKRKENQLKRYQDGDIFSDFHRRFNELFDQFFDETGKGFQMPSLWKEEDNWFQTPDIDVSENSCELKVEANLPGLDEKDIQVNLDGDRLIIKAEKCEEKEDKDSKYHLSERRCGKFQRVIPIREDVVDRDKIKAELKKGVLRITLPKLPGRETQTKKIAISAG